MGNDGIRRAILMICRAVMKSLTPPMMAIFIQHWYLYNQLFSHHCAASWTVLKNEPTLRFIEMLCIFFFFSIYHKRPLFCCKKINLTSVHWAKPVIFYSSLHCSGSSACVPFPRKVNVLPSGTITGLIRAVWNCDYLQWNWLNTELKLPNWNDILEPIRLV